MPTKSALEERGKKQINIEMTPLVLLMLDQVVDSLNDKDPANNFKRTHVINSLITREFRRLKLRV